MAYLATCFGLAPNEHAVGGGERFDGPDLRGKVVPLVFEVRQARQGRVPREAAARGRARGLRRAAHHRCDGRWHAGRARRRLAQSAHRRQARGDREDPRRPPELGRERLGQASKYTEDLGSFEGRAREPVEAKLRAETDRLVAAERQLAETERDRLDLEVVDREAEWIGAALSDFARVWKLMTPENQGRLLRASSPPSA